MNNNINYENYNNNNTYKPNNMVNNNYNPNNYNGNNMGPNNYNNIDNNNRPPKKGGAGFIVLLIIVILALSGYIAYDKGLFDSFINKDTTNTTTNSPTNSNNNENTDKDKEKEDNSNSSDNSNTSPTNNPTYSFDLSKCSNCDSNYNYHLMAGGDLAYATLNEDNKSVVVTIDYDKVKNTGNEVNATGQKEYTIPFSKNVSDIHYGGYGLDTSYGTILFLMEDGTIEYIPILDAAIKGKIASYGQISNVNNIVKIYSDISATSKGNVGAYYTTFAQSTDGTLYDIMTILSKTENYSYSG